VVSQKLGRVCSSDGGLGRMPPSPAHAESRCQSGDGCSPPKAYQAASRSWIFLHIGILSRIADKNLESCRWGPSTPATKKGRACWSVGPESSAHTAVWSLPLGLAAALPCPAAPCRSGRHCTDSWQPSGIPAVWLVLEHLRGVVHGPCSTPKSRVMKAASIRQARDWRGSFFRPPFAPSLSLAGNNNDLARRLIQYCVASKSSPIYLASPSELSVYLDSLSAEVLFASTIAAASASSPGALLFGITQVPTPRRRDPPSRHRR
jgi:hypothetical protein